MKRRTIAFCGFVLCLLVATTLLFRQDEPELLPDVLIPLRELPGITQATLASQGTLFRIEEPVLYNRDTKMGVFVVEILSRQNFDDETLLVIGGDARSLECFGNEIAFVNAGPSRVLAAGGGAVDGVKSLVGDLWQLLRHPIDTVHGVASGIEDASVYVWNTSTQEMTDDAAQLASAFYYARVVETAESHKLDYFDLKTPQGKAAVESETNSRLVGRAAAELALLFAPFNKWKSSYQVSTASKALSSIKSTVLASKKSVLGAAELTIAIGLFPKMVEKMTETLTRLKSATETTRIRSTFAKLGHAVSTDYRATFLAANKGLDASSVVIHHAVEQQALRRYPGIVTEAQIHSLENLRGIPKALDATLHKAAIRKIWDEFYRNNPANGMTLRKLTEQASVIDRKFGCHFTPRCP